MVDWFAFNARLFVTVVEKFSSSFKALASSFNVFKASGAESTKLAIAVSTSVFVYVVDWFAFNAKLLSTSVFVYVVDWFALPFNKESVSV